MEGVASIYKLFIQAINPILVNSTFIFILQYRYTYLKFEFMHWL